MFHVCSVTTIRVPCCVELDTWHVVSAGRHASQGYLQLDDTLVKGKSGGSHLTHHSRTSVCEDNDDPKYNCSRYDNQLSSTSHSAQESHVFWGDFMQ